MWSTRLCEVHQGGSAEPQDLLGMYRPARALLGSLGGRDGEQKPESCQQEEQWASVSAARRGSVEGTVRRGCGGVFVQAGSHRGP